MIWLVAILVGLVAAAVTWWKAEGDTSSIVGVGLFCGLATYAILYALTT